MTVNRDDRACLIAVDEAVPLAFGTMGAALKKCYFMVNAGGSDFRLSDDSDIKTYLLMR